MDRDTDPIGGGAGGGRGPQDGGLGSAKSDRALLAECDVTTFKSRGPGGQSVNTTDSAVRLKHRPTGIVTVCRRERSQHLNKKECLARLRVKLAAAEAGPPPPRVPTRPSKSAAATRLDEKARRATIKRLRRPPDEE